MNPHALRRLRWLSVAAAMVAVVGCQQAAPAPAANAQPNPTNELPFGVVEAPPAHAGVERQLVVGGWAIDDEGVKEVRVFVDNKYVGRTTLTEARPDVSKAYPNYPGDDNHGWVLSVTLGPTVAAGPHTVLAQAVDSQGATRDIGTVDVIVAP